MSNTNQPFFQETPLLFIRDGETYDQAVQRTLHEQQRIIEKLMKDKRSSLSWQNLLLFVAGFVLYLTLANV